MPPVIHFAPLHGVTNRIFRRAFFNHFPGFDTALAPFVFTLKALPDRKAHFRDLLPENNAGIDLIPQLLGNEPEDFVTTGLILADLGYTEINWNLGCPYARVADKKRGSGLLPCPDMISRVLDAACSRLPVTVSVKLRLGRHDPREILALMPVFNDRPLKRIIIHPRIGTQMYKGTVDLDGFAAAAALSRHPVMYNGDIRDPAVFGSLQTRFPSVDQWMIGRWAITDPFLIGRLRGGVPVTDHLLRLKGFHDELMSLYREILSGPGHLLDKMKELMRYWAPSFPRNQQELHRLARSESVGEYEKNISVLFEKGSWMGRR